MPVHRGSLGLPGQIDHFLHGFGIAGDNDGLNFNLVLLEVSDDVFTPGAAGFNVEDG